MLLLLNFGILPAKTTPTGSAAGHAAKQTTLGNSPPRELGDKLHVLASLSDCYLHQVFHVTFLGLAQQAMNVTFWLNLVGINSKSTYTTFIAWSVMAVGKADIPQ